MICNIVTLLLRGVTDSVTRGRSSIHKLRVPFHNGVCWSMIVRSSCTERKGKVPQWQIMQITCRSILGYPTTPTFSSSLRMCAVKEKEKKLFGDKGLRKKFQKTRDIDIYRQEDYFEKFEWERQSEKIFYVEKFFGKSNKNAI